MKVNRFCAILSLVLFFILPCFSLKSVWTPRFVVGDKLTYVDLALLHVLRAAKSQFSEAFNALNTIPLLKAFMERISARPNLAAYFASDRCRPFEGNSMMWISYQSGVLKAVFVKAMNLF